MCIRDRNGDLLFWNEPLQCSYERSSMGIRVSPESMDKQLTMAGCDDRRAQMCIRDSFMPSLHLFLNFAAKEAGGRDQQHDDQDRKRDGILPCGKADGGNKALAQADGRCV